MAAPTPSSQASSSDGATGNYGFALSTLTTLFFLWGFLTVLNDVLIPYLKEVFALNYTQSMLVQFAFFGAYFIGSLIYFLISAGSGDPIQRIGYKNGIIVGLGISALGCGLFYPAAEFEVFGFFLGALFVLGLGFTLLQIAANPYVAILGKPETASSRLNLAQGFNSFGTTIGPIIGVFLVFTYFATPGEDPTADSVKIPYLALAGIFVLVAILFTQIKLPVMTSSEKVQSGFGALKYPQLTLGILAIFFYVGGEVAVGSILINYLGLENTGNMSNEEAGNFLSLYWGGLMIGRFVGSISLSDMADQTKKWLYMIGAAVAAFFVIYLVNSGNLSFMEIVPWLGFVALNLAAFYLGSSLPARTLTVFASAIIGLLLVVIFGSGQLAVWSVIGIGLFCSIMWSNIFTLSIDGLGEHTSQGSSLLIMGILGGALIPVLQGGLADILGTAANPDAGVQLSFIIPLLCFSYHIFYGLVGYKMRPKVGKSS